MGDPLYGERRRLERENDLLREQERNRRLKREAAADEIADLAMAAIKAFLKGEAILSINPGNSEGCHMVSFQMPPAAPAST